MMREQRTPRVVLRGRRWSSSPRSSLDGPPGPRVRLTLEIRFKPAADPHTVMAFSGHRAPSMLRRYHIIDLDDLRRAAERGASYQGGGAKVEPLQADASLT